MPVTLQYGIRDVEILARETVFQGHFAVAKLTLRHRRFGGDWSREMTREVFERGDAVGVLPYDPVTDSVILIEQFRPGAYRTEGPGAGDSPWMLELIAGVVETGESDLEVAHREAGEEAGCTLDQMEPIATFFPSAGACSEQVRLFCGRTVTAGVGAVHGLATENEDILVHQVSREDAMALVAADRIPNAHTLISLQWLCLHGDDLRRRWLDSQV